MFRSALTMPGRLPTVLGIVCKMFPVNHPSKRSYPIRRWDFAEWTRSDVTTVQHGTLGLNFLGVNSRITPCVCLEISKSFQSNRCPEHLTFFCFSIHLVFLNSLYTGVRFDGFLPERWTITAGTLGWGRSVADNTDCRIESHCDRPVNLSFLPNPIAGPQLTRVALWVS